jgi:hypothetical protein
MPSGFLEKVNSIDSKLESVAREALAAGAEVVVTALRKRLREVISDSGRSTGELVSALGVSQMRLDRNGNYDVKVGFMEPRSDGKVNALIANVIEHGWKKRNGIRPPRPFLAPTKAKTGRACKKEIKRIFEERFGK